MSKRKGPMPTSEYFNAVRQYLDLLGGVDALTADARERMIDLEFLVRRRTNTGRRLTLIQGGLTLEPREHGT